MRRAALTFVATVVGLVLLLGYKSHGSATLLRPGAFASLRPSAPTTPSAPTPRATAPLSSPSTARTPATRTVVGQVADTPYGPVQIEVVVGGGRITSVQPLQLPQSTGRDIEIDNYAVPQLIQETLARQSASIDAVSGATYTSEGYLQSLQSALDKLHA